MKLWTEELDEIGLGGLPLDLAFDLHPDRPWMTDDDLLNAKRENEKEPEKARETTFPKKLPDGIFKKMPVGFNWSNIIGPNGYKFSCRECGLKFTEWEVMWWYEWRGVLKGVECPNCEGDNCRLGWRE